MNTRGKYQARFLLWILFVVFPAMGTWTCSTSPGAEDEKDKLKKTVRVTRVGRMDIEHVLRYVADLKPYSEVKHLLDFHCRS